MRRRLPAVFLAALLTFAVSGCGDDSDDSSEPTNDESTSQSDGATTDDADDTDDTDDADDTATEDPEPTETDDTDDGGDKNDRDDSDKGDKDDGESDDSDDNGAIPDDLESGEPDDPNDLPIPADVVLDTCEDVDPKDTWPAPGAVSFDDEGRSVVATADVEVKGGQPITIVCAIAGSENNPQVKAYNPI